MIRTISRRQALMGFGAVGLGSVAAAPALAHTGDSNESSGYPLPGSVGFVRGQLARLSVVHHAHGKTEFPPTPCNIVASILGRDGMPIVTETFKDLGSNEARFVDLPHPGGKGPRRKTRVEIQDLVRFTPGHEIGSSLQIIDLATGSTTLFPPVPCNVPDPTLGGQQLEPSAMAFPHGGTVGLVKGQLLRISVVHHEHGKSEVPPVPCVIVAEVFDAGGKLVASELFQDVKGHEAVFLDLPHPGGQKPRRDTRLELSLHVRHTPGHLIGATGQVIDLATGVTLYPPSPPCNFPDPTI